MAIQTRTLAPDEIQKAIDAGGPLADLQASPERMAEMAVAVVEVDGAVVAYWVCWYALHVEPLWIHPDWRKHPAVVGGIVGEMQKNAEATGEPAAFCVIEAENLLVVAPYAKRLGFYEAPGTLYYLMLQQPAEAPAEG